MDSNEWEARLMPRNYSVAETIRQAKEKYESQNFPKEPEEFIEHTPTKDENIEVFAKEQQQTNIDQTPEQINPQSLLSKITQKLKWW